MKKLVLIIEDNIEVCENTAELLELAGYVTITANNGKEGLELAQKNRPDIILCDIMMPVLDGYGVLRAFENIPGMMDIPFVFMTAKAEKSDFRKGMDMGADDYLTKPFTGDELLRIVSARLKKSEAIKTARLGNLFKENKYENTSVKERNINLFTEHKTVKKLGKKAMLFMEGDSTNFLYFIISGKVKVYKSNDFGKELIINIYKEGDFLGYTSLLENSNHKESAMAIEDTEVALIPKLEFFQLLSSNNEVAIQFVKLMSNNFSEAGEKLLKLAYDSARKRVAEAIIFVSKKYQTEGKNELCFTLHRENISALSGISPESVSRNISDFKSEGLIETHNGSIKILEFKKLETLRN